MKGTGQTISKQTTQGEDGIINQMEQHQTGIPTQRGNGLSNVTSEYQEQDFKSGVKIYVCCITQLQLSDVT